MSSSRNRDGSGKPTDNRKRRFLRPAKKAPVKPARRPQPGEADPDAELYEQGDIATPKRDPPYEDGF
jgi:hypothetical protein